jgi:hypothetical protein
LFYLRPRREEILLVVLLAVVGAVELLESLGLQRNAAVLTFQAAL